jgi:hypothetical protein
MTPDQLQQKHLQAIENYTDFVNTNKKAAAKQCALITIEHTIGVLNELLPDSNLPEFDFSIWRATMIDKLGLKIQELKKQKEQL